GVRPVGSALQLGVELATDHERVILHFGNLNETAVGRRAREHQATIAQRLAKVVVELVAMAVPFEHNRLVIGVTGPGAWSQLAWIDAEALRRTLVFNIALLRQEINHGVAREEVEFGRIRLSRIKDMARELD